MKPWYFWSIARMVFLGPRVEALLGSIDVPWYGRGHFLILVLLRRGDPTFNGLPTNRSECLLLPHLQGYVVLLAYNLKELHGRGLSYYCHEAS